MDEDLFHLGIKKVQKKSKRNETYLSHTIQNDFIEALRIQAEGKIVSEIKEATLFSVIFDSTIDVSHCDQLSFCFWYVDSLGKIQEQFLGFEILEEATASNLDNITATLIIIHTRQCIKSVIQGYLGR